MATRNLPPDSGDQTDPGFIRLSSDQSKFTGFDDRNRVKTINIITKKDKRQGYFGKAVAGVGTNQNYDESVNMHRFNNDEQISVLGQANDINKQNFTAESGPGGRGGGSASPPASNTGVTTIWAAGANYKNAFGDKTDFNGSYFFNSQHIVVNQRTCAIKIHPGTVAGHQYPLPDISRGSSSQPPDILQYLNTVSTAVIRWCSGRM